MFKNFLIAMIPLSTLLASCTAVQPSGVLTRIALEATPQRASPVVVNETEKVVVEVARYNGINPSAFLKMAKIESGLDPNAYHPKSKACGLFQFIPSTAKVYKLSDCRNPRANAEAAAKLWKDNATFLKRTLGRMPTAGEIYLAHQQGARGASALLENPDVPAADIVGKKAVLMNGGDESMTAAGFANLWMSKFEGV